MYRGKEGSAHAEALNVEKMAKDLVTADEILYMSPHEVLEKYVERSTVVKSLTLVAWCECYANKCLQRGYSRRGEKSARKLEDVLTLHLPNMGRDKILKKVLNAVEKGRHSRAKHIPIILRKGRLKEI